MAWTTPGTAVAGEVYTAAFYNEQTRDNLNFLYTPPMCHVRRTAALSIANNTDTTIPFTATPLFDTDSMFDSGSNTNVTIQTSGIYQVSFSTRFANSGAGSRSSKVLLNGNVIDYLRYFIANEISVGVNTQNGASMAVKLAAADVLTLQAYQNRGSALDLEFAYLSVVWIGTD